MSFLIDKQTLEDLNLLGKYKPNSVFGMFNKVKTSGGEMLLEDFFRHPLTDTDAINRRANVFRQFGQLDLKFPVSGKKVEVMESYLHSGASRNRFSAPVAMLGKKIRHTLGVGKEYALMVESLYVTIEVLDQLFHCFNKLSDFGEVEGGDLKAAGIFLDTMQLRDLRNDAGNRHLPLGKIMKYDNLLRFHLREEMEKVLKAVYYLDLCIAVTETSRERKFVYASALPSSSDCLKIIDCRHPGITKAIGNSADMDRSNNLLFLTGANMAGKSTFMKSVGIAVYLAHMGFPVAAEQMEFSVRDGIYTSINVPDDLQQGFSHFYAEVKRVKMVAEAVGSGKNMVIIFDELFKGTNVKDAYDATLEVTKAFSVYRNCCFIISTHIIEVAEPLNENCENIRFAYMPTVMEGNTPRYTYRMKEGVTEDRHGMMIIRNERILELMR